MCCQKNNKSYITNIMSNATNLASELDLDEIDLTDKATKTAFSTLKIKIPKAYIEFKFADKIIQVIQYLPESNKLENIEIAYYKSIVNNQFDPLLFNTFFLLNIVYSYTNLTFTDEQKKNEGKLFDMIKSSGLLDNILGAMNALEVDYYAQNIDNYINTKLMLDYSAAGITNNAINAINTFSGVISEKLSSLDEETVKKFLDYFSTMTDNNNKKSIEQTK